MKDDIFKDNSADSEDNNQDSKKQHEEPPYSEMEIENQRVKDLMHELVGVLSKLYSKSQEVDDIIHDIEHEGYQIDIFMAYLTKLVKKESNNMEYILNSYDQKFLEKIGVKYENGDSIG